MSNQITKCIIKSCYVIKVQNGHLDFILKFAIFVQKRKLYASALCSFKDWATINLPMKKGQTVCAFVGGKDVASCFSQG